MNSPALAVDPARLAVLITPAQLQQLAPNSNYVALAPLLNAAALTYAINTPLRVAHWLAQGAEESEGFTKFEEDLNYTVANLRREWPSRYPSDEAATPYAHNPQALANAVYQGRMGNVNVGDGWLFRGRGVFDLTGRSDYIAIGAIAGKPYVDHPELVSALPGAAETAGAFWKWRALNPLADADDLNAITVRINGGLSGLSSRRAWLKRTKAIWGVKSS